MSESFKKKKILSQGPFPFFSNKMEHPHVKCSLFFLIVLVNTKLPTTKLLSRQKLCEKRQTQRKINLILTTYQF